MNRLPYLAVFFAAVLLVAAEKKPEKAKEPAPSDAQIQLWIKQLGDDDFKVREEATRDLINAGEVAFDAVSKATNSEDAEVKQRALMILKHPEKVAKQFEKTAIAYFENLGSVVTVDEKSPGMPVIGLCIPEPKITDVGLAHLKRLTKLHNLYLNYTIFTDAELVHLKGLTSLQVLNLGGTDITDAGLVHLKGLTSLQYLDLRETKITGAGLVHLKGLTSLPTLLLNHTKVTDTGLEHLKGLSSLKYFYLQNTKVTDAGLVHLKGLTNLQSLKLSHTEVTDAGLVHLNGLANLQELSLVATKVTQGGIEKLQKALPKCDINWDGQATKQKQKDR